MHEGETQHPKKSPPSLIFKKIAIFSFK